MDLSGLKVGYIPYSHEFTAPGDRRRFWFYAQKRGLNYEIADPSKDYDIIFLTCLTDLGPWINFSKRGKIIFELVDSYLAIPKNNAKSYLKGLFRFLTRKDKHLRLNHRKTLVSILQKADAVVCSTVEQKNDIKKYCRNVHVILDIHSGVTQDIKIDYASSNAFNLVWEGLPINVELLSEIHEVLSSLNSKYEIALHLLTDLKYGQYMNKYWMRHTKNIAKKIFDNVYLYEWNEYLCSKIVTACDLAIIPLPLDDPLASGKPENKLLLFWRMGMPTLVSATPAYKRTMDQAGLPMACQTQQDWQTALTRYIEDEAARKIAGQQGKAFVDTHHSEEHILAKWDALLLSVLD